MEMNKQMKHQKKAVMLLGFIIFVIISVLTGAYVLYYNGKSDIMIHPEYREGQIRVACVGDSITYGYGIKNQPENNYPIFLGELLGDGFQVCNFGNIRVTVQPDGDQPYIKTYTYRDSVEYPADILIFMMGTNDAKKLNWQGADKFREDYLALLDDYVSAKNPPKVYLCSPATALFPEGETQGASTYGIQPLVVDEISVIVREIAEERGYGFIDINAATDDRRDLYGKDLIHPNYDGARLIASTVYAYLAKDGTVTK